ncbi:hypothetical protein [Escherichia marmotae]|uniref:hypothetical protein n=1 Tax=Escherichia marmotae TaxID=1499973 RepID=UPI0023DE1612|nr:hypothetical protein [Escherichia marmotae]MED9340120.1 hypothetical protein [Escherichia marmotae]MED9469107.1 hypothetical protein [Escherichia marmotae]
MCEMPALVLWKSALSLVLATLPLIFLLTPSGQPAPHLIASLGCHCGDASCSCRIVADTM